MDEGWYKDPYGEADMRWWDGQQWTEHVENMPPAQPAHGPSGGSSWGGAPSQPAQHGWGGGHEQGFDQSRGGFGPGSSSFGGQPAGGGFGSGPSPYGAHPGGGFGPGAGASPYGQSPYGAHPGAGFGGQQPSPYGPGGGFGPGGPSPFLTEAPRSRRKLYVGIGAAVLVVAVLFSALTRKPAEETGDQFGTSPAEPTAPADGRPPLAAPVPPVPVVQACANWGMTAGVGAAEIDRLMTVMFEGGPVQFAPETLEADRASMLELLDVLQRYTLVPTVTVVDAVRADPAADPAVQAEVGMLAERTTNAAGLLGMTLTAVTGAQSAEMLTAAANPGLQSLIDVLRLPAGMPALAGFLQQFPECGPFIANIPPA